ncbi:MAG: hypothetical protein A2934_04125, partial [Candidatus Sungbacteria bacterium RIFCSPLOWO2_01_FULL_47_10]
MTPKREEFFRKLDILAVTFNDLAVKEFDITVKTDYSDVLPHQVSVETKMTRNVGLKIPIISAAMDTVTGIEMAIEMAKLGGMGIIHRNFSPEDRIRAVARVKHHFHGGKIEKPIAVRPVETLEEVLNRRTEKGYPFHSFPVLDDERRFVGLITQNHFKFKNHRVPIREIMMPREFVLVGSDQTTVNEAYDLMRVNEKGVLPCVDGEGQLCGIYVYSDLKRLKNGPLPYNLDARGQLRSAVAIGIGDRELYCAEECDRKHVDVLVINTAHADTEGCLGFLRELKSGRIRADISVGNISEAHSAQRLCEAGADGLIAGQGGGSICTTRPVAGIGCPQATAIHYVSVVGDSYGVPTGGDGGIQCIGHASVEECVPERTEELIKDPGDTTKAIGA